MHLTVKKFSIYTKAIEVTFSFRVICTISFEFRVKLVFLV